MSEPKRTRRGRLRIFVLLCTVASTLVALEVGVRVYAALFVPGLSFFRDDRLTSPWFLTYAPPPPAFDADGTARFAYRVEPVTIAKPAGVRRILAVGGSTTVNRYSVERGGRDTASWLEELLNARSAGERVEVLNCGGDAFSTAHSLVNLQLRLLELDPDVIVLMENINDLSVNYHGAGATSDYSNKYLLPFYVNPTLQAGTSLRGFLNQSRLLAATGLLGVFPQGELALMNDIAPGLRYFRRNLLAIGALCAREGIELVLLTQPSRMRDVPYYDRAHFTRYNQAITEVATELGCRSIDMHTLFGHDPEDFVDEFHYSPRGAQRFATLLAEQWVR